MSREETRKLPLGWEQVKLGEICRLIGGMQPPKHTFKYQPHPGYIRLVQIQDFRRSDLKVYIPQDEARRTFDESDVMIGRYGPPVFQILRGLSGAYNVALMKTEPETDRINKDYLFFLLQSPSIQNAVVGQSQRAAGQTGVQKEFVEKMNILLPPLTEQKRITAILTEQMAAVEKARAAAEARLKAAKELPAAYLREVFGGEDAKGWPVMALGDAGDVVSGVTLGRKMNNSKVRAVPYLRVANVKDGHLALDDVKTVEVTEDEIKRWRLQAGDLLLSRP